MNFHAIGHLYKQFAYGLTREYVHDVMMEFGEENDYFDLTDGEASSDGEVAKAAVLAPSRATSCVPGSIDIITTI